MTWSRRGGREIGSLLLGECKAELNEVEDG